MKLSRSTSIIVAVILLVGFFVVALTLGQKRDKLALTAPVATPTPAPTAALSLPALGDLPAVKMAVDPMDSSTTFRLDRFHRSETKDGKLVWEVDATSGTYSPEKNSVVVTDVKLTLYRTEGEPIELLSKKATLFLDGVGLRRAEATGDVVVRYGGKGRLETQMAYFEQDKNQLTAPGKVAIFGEMIDIKGESLVGNVLTKEFQLERAVETVIRPQAGKKNKNLSNG